MVDFKVGDYVRASQGGSVIIGKVYDLDWTLPRPYVDIGFDLPQPTYATLGISDWEIEVIPKPIVLPTKRDAVIRINGESYWLVDIEATDSWIDLEGFWYGSDAVRIKAEAAGGFEVIFEGRD